MRKILCILLLFSVVGFAAETVADNVAAPADSAATMSAPQETCGEFKSEIAHRDSLMAVADSSCSVEKDSLRAAIEVEKAKSDNWEKSYNTIKKDNETCAQMLSTSIGVNEKKKEKEDQDRRSAAMATSSSFLGGFGVGMLVMWLIMK